MWMIDSFKMWMQKIVEYQKFTLISTRSLCTIFDLDVNDCMPDPCKNSGNCTDGINEYNCTCIPGYNGTNCETGKLMFVRLYNESP